MTRKQLPQTWATSTRTRGYEPAKPRYHGSGMIYGPAGTGLGWTEESVQCEHEHGTIDAAIECGARLARKVARERAAATEALYVRTPCRVGVVEDRMIDETLYIKVCATHRTNARVLKPTAEEADAVEWTCPWAKFVREAN